MKTNGAGNLQQTSQKGMAVWDKLKEGLFLTNSRLVICNQVLRTLLFLQSLLCFQKDRQIPSQTLGKDYRCLNLLRYMKSWTIALELANAHAGSSLFYRKVLLLPRRESSSQWLT